MPSHLMQLLYWSQNYTLITLEKARNRNLITFMSIDNVILRKDNEG
jgi:hypothetical protein